MVNMNMTLLDYYYRDRIRESRRVTSRQHKRDLIDQSILTRRYTMTRGEIVLMNHDHDDTLTELKSTVNSSLFINPSANIHCLLIILGANTLKRQRYSFAMSLWLPLFIDGRSNFDLLDLHQS